MPADNAAQPAEPTADPTKDRFREALERKRERHHANNGDAQNDSKVHGEHSRVGGKRTFRRKSGG
jgi:uncharacterized protein DUF5302